MTGPDRAPAASPALALRDVRLDSGRAGNLLSQVRVNWEIAPGSWWIVGALPGGGKSLLVATMAGLHPPLSGMVVLLGHPLTPGDPALLSLLGPRVGVVFDGGGRLFHDLTVFENILLPLLYHRPGTPDDLEATVRSWIDWAGLGEWEGTRATRLRRSVQQRVSLVRAVVTGPEVVLVDNPLGGLPVQESQWWFDRLGELNAGSTPFGLSPMTLAVTCDDFRPWLNARCQFALFTAAGWRIVGDRGALDPGNDPELGRLLGGG